MPSLGAAPPPPPPCSCCVVHNPRPRASSVILASECRCAAPLKTGPLRTSRSPPPPVQTQRRAAASLSRRAVPLLPLLRLFVHVHTPPPPLRQHRPCAVITIPDETVTFRTSNLTVAIGFQFVSYCFP